MTTPSTPPQAAPRGSVNLMIAVAVAITILFALLFALWHINAPVPSGIGIPVRTPWTTAHVSGSPEPPPPYEMERAFAKLKFNRPLDVAFIPGSNRIVVLEQKGKMFSFPNNPDVEKADPFFEPTLLQNLKTVRECKGSHDFLALTFHPQFAKNRYCYVQYDLNYTVRRRNNVNGSRISRFTVTDTDPPRIDPASELIVLQWLSGGHNGCTLRFGPDGYLYISTGDGADPAPPDDMNTGQDISDLLSSILRIDVNHPGKDVPYSIPKDNPFVSTPGARGEVWAYGLRNPFRMNFDSKTGNLWVGDVGWELWEMIHCVKSGGNYGWSIMEGPNPIHPDGKRGPTEISKPQAALMHTDAASITGGIVYRGKKLPALEGHYIFGDWMTSRFWSAKCVGEKEDTLEPYKDLATTHLRVAAIVEDPEHEPIVVDHGGGGLYRIVPNPSVGHISKFPRKLSDTGLFASVKEQTPAPGVYPFSVNASQWVDGATAERWVAFPEKTEMSWTKGVWYDNDVPKWPKDSVLVRTLSLEMRVGDPKSKKRVETQLLHFDGKQWNGYSYAWNDDQSDADLVANGGDEKPFTIADFAAPGGTRRQTWRYPSRTQCLTCHNIWCDYTLAFNPLELDRMEKFHRGENDDVMDNQVQAFRRIGFLLEPKAPDEKDKPSVPPESLVLTDPYDSKANLTERARSYLHINCSHCHRNGAGGTALFDVNKDRHPYEMKAIDVRPVLGDFGIDGAKLISAGDPNRSVILYRASKLGRSRMPQIGSDCVDEKGTAMLRQWIEGLVSENVPESALKELKEEQQRDLQTIQSAGAKADDAVNAALDRLLAKTSGAMELLGCVQSRTLSESVRQAALAKGIASAQETSHDLFRRFDPREQFIVRLGTNVDRAKLAAMPGDAARGRAVFFDAASSNNAAPAANVAPGSVSGTCATCHKINGQGKDFGPDLSHIATKYTKAQLLENILEPSKTIAEGFALYLVKTKAGERISGLLVRKTETEVVFKDQQKEYHYTPGEIEQMKASPVSAMPESLMSNMSPQDGADLLEFLSTLK